MSADNVRWGIISTARIGEMAFIPAVRQTERGELVAVASRDRDRASSFAQKHGIPRVFDDYRSMLASDEIDAVYNPLPNTMHREWTELAAANGKHIFCEKPLATKVADAEAMVGACEKAGVLFFEAFVFLYHPQTRKLQQCLDEGAIGELRQLHAHITGVVTRPTDNIRLNRDLGGGSLYDVGCYPITLARCAFGEEPVGFQSVCKMDEDYEVDTRVAMVLEFSRTRTASLQAGFDAFGQQRAFLFGSEGMIEVAAPFHPPQKSHFTIRRPESEDEVVSFDEGFLHFAPAIEHFHDCLLDGARPLKTAAYAAGTLRIIEQALERAQNG